MNIKEKKSLFDQNGAVTFTQNESIYTNDQWDLISTIVFHKDLPVETVEIGDVGEPNQVDVARFMTDVEIPQFVNNSFSEPLMGILFNQKAEVFLKDFLQKDNLHLRRCQLNKISKGGFIGKHLDCDSNPDYLVAIILHFDEDFEGGNFIYYPKGEPKEIKTEKNCLIISSCSIEHEVKKVESGTRRTLVFFLSENDKQNKSDKLIYK